MSYDLSWLEEKSTKKPEKEIKMNSKTLDILVQRIEFDNKLCKYYYFEDLLFPYNVEAYNFRKDYKKQKGSWTGWTSAYSEDPRYDRPLEITWDFWEDFFKINVPCFECNRIIENFEEYTPHHLVYTEKYWNLFQIVPLHSNSNCHKKGKFIPQFTYLYYLPYKAAKWFFNNNRIIVK